MSTVKFETTVEDGKIVIPMEFRGRIKGKIEVIVKSKDHSDFEPMSRDEIYDRKKDRAENFIRQLMKNPLEVDKSVPFLTRDEIYDRKL